MAGLETVEDDRWCFACGENNPIGLKLQFEEVDGDCIAKFTPKKEHQGYTGITHGGIMSTLLDEIMAQLVIKDSNRTVTAEMNVRFRRPARTGVELTLAAKITGEDRKSIHCSAQATDPEGQVIAEATARMVKI